MSVTYNRLWKLLIDKHMKRTDLIEACSLSSNVIARLGKNQYVSLETIDKLCQYFKCEIQDIIKVELERDE